MTMDDLTSGFNIGTNYSLDSRFNEMTGFTEVEVRAMLQEYSEYYDYNHSIDELIQIMKPWYDNYCFAKESYGKLQCIIPIWFCTLWINISIMVV